MCCVHVCVCVLDSGTREKSVEESVERAKEAVAMDVKDGISWSELSLSTCLCTVVVWGLYELTVLMLNLVYLSAQGVEHVS